MTKEFQTLWQGAHKLLVYSACYSLGKKSSIGTKDAIECTWFALLYKFRSVACRGNDDLGDIAQRTPFRMCTNFTWLVICGLLFFSFSFSLFRLFFHIFLLSTLLTCERDEKKWKKWNWSQELNLLLDLPKQQDLLLIGRHVVLWSWRCRRFVLYQLWCANTNFAGL